MNDIKSWLPVIAAILAAGMWLGALEHRVTSLEDHQKYEHGSYDVPKEAR
jgi:hypothetical protein